MKELVFLLIYYRVVVFIDGEVGVCFRSIECCFRSVVGFYVF